MKLWLYRMGISRSVRRPGWLGTVTVTCATFPSLTLGSPGRDAIPLLIDGHDTGRYFEVLPHHLSLALPFRHQYLAVRRRQLDHQRQLLPGRDSLAVTQVGLYGRDGSLRQVNFHPQFDPHGRAASQRKQGGQRQAGHPVCAQQTWNADFGKYGQSSSMWSYLLERTKIEEEVQLAASKVPWKYGR